MRGIRFSRLISPRLLCSRPLASYTRRTMERTHLTPTSSHPTSFRKYSVTRILFDVRTVETPTFPDSVTEGDIQWLKEVGDAVEEDEVIGEIETDKTTLPVQSPVSGVITELLVADQSTVRKGTQLVKIDVGGGAAPALDKASAPPPPPVPAPVPAQDASPAPFSAKAPSGDPITVKVPTFPDSVSEGDLSWLKEVGDTVDADEVIGEIETDKTTLTIQAPCAGVITSLLVDNKSTVTKDLAVAVVTPGFVAPVSEATPAPPPATAAAAAPPPPPPATPVAPPPLPKAPVSTAPPPLPPLDLGDVKPPGMRSESRVKMSRMRLRIAERLKEAQNTAAMLTTFNEIDMTNIMALRSKFKDDFLKKHEVKLGFMSAFLKASAQALQEMPEVNAFIDGKEIVYRDYVDISVAVATPKGLVVPVLRNVETMSYAGIELALNSLGKKARDGALAIEDMDGGTFTVSNGGVFGSLYGTPIINLPQSAILGMHAIQDRPVARGGQVVIRPMMYIALTYDHRLIDGREAVTFLRRIKAAVEDPAILLLDI